MLEDPTPRYLQLMHNRIDPIRVPFSDMGSRILLYRYSDKPAFYIKLAERLEKLEQGLEAHRVRHPFLTEIRLLDGDGRQLHFECETYPHVVRCHTSIGRFEITFSGPDTIAIGLPQGQPGGVSFQVSDLFNSPSPSPDDLSSTRHVELQSNLAVKLEETVSVNDGRRQRYILKAGEQGSILIGLMRAGQTGKEPRQFTEILQVAKARWSAWFDGVPSVHDELAPAYAYAWWTLGNNLVAPLGNIHYEAVMPSKAQYLGIWNWDACFHSVGLRHLDPELARNQLRTILAGQSGDGMIPDVVHDEGVVDHIEHPFKARVTKPPVIAWAALKIHTSDPDTHFLEEIYPALKRWNRWWREQNSGEGTLLAHYKHPYSSGLDDNPLWDHGFPVVAPDLNTYLVIQMEALSTIAKILGYEDDAQSWNLHAEQLSKRILAELYDQEEGFFWAYHARKPILERTPFNLYPLWTGRMPSEVESRLIDHLKDPELFWTPNPLSTVAHGSKSFSPTTMWRGPVWININYIFVEALERIGESDLASELRRKTIELVSGNQGMYEYYNPEDGSPPGSAAPIFSWTAALFIDLCLQEASEAEKVGKQA